MYKFSNIKHFLISGSYCHESTNSTTPFLSSSILSTTSTIETSDSTFNVGLTTNSTESTSTSNKSTFTLKTDQYLTHHWPISNGARTDSVGNAHMQQGSLTTFVSDRFGCPNSALNLNQGYTLVPPGIYFDTPQFTISVWIYPQLMGWWSRVIDFGDGAPLNSIFLSQDSNSNQKPALWIYDGSTSRGQVTSSTPLDLSQWHMLTATFDGTLASIYINGVFQGSASVVHNFE